MATSEDGMRSTYVGPAHPSWKASVLRSPTCSATHSRPASTAPSATYWLHGTRCDRMSAAAQAARHAQA